MTGSSRLPKRLRRDRILAELRLSATARISDLAERLGVSGETIRRDLEEMGREGLISRTYGGAVARPLGFEPTMNERFAEMSAEREKIAELACSLVQPGEALMIDSGTTTLHFARRLAAVANGLTVVTNSFPVAGALAVNRSVQVICCPGTFDAGEACVFGPETVTFLGRFHANRAVISASGLTAEGPTEINAGAASIKRAMLARSAQHILLVDHGKFDQPSLETVCPLSALHCLVTDAPPLAALRDALGIARTEVLC
jgi:DeoR/GlpR family transcriptional regulator of sugar metabolism